jgi:EAL domain-containing protein (putative c-di-GMP-specific phosphodiesterase class I)/GGDEF domain-containing protein
MYRVTSKDNIDQIKLLTSYLQEIIYSPENAYIDHSLVLPTHQKLINLLDVLLKKILESNELTQKLEVGSLYQVTLSLSDDAVTRPYKSVQGLLKYLVGIMDKIADGDVAQRMLVVNDISVAFNRMVDGLAEMSEYDSVTGLLNVEGFCKKIDDMFSTSAACGPYYIVYFRMNDFYRIHAAYGKQRGDVYLSRFADYLRRIVQYKDLGCHIYENQYVCCMTGESVESVVERLQTERDTFPDIESFYNQTFQCGIYAVQSQCIPTEKMIEYAAMACEAATKSMGMNYSIFDEAMAHRCQQQSTLLLAFKRAVSQGEFQVQYQPIVNMATKKIVGCKAATRWPKLHGGVYMPDEFIPLLEKHRVIDQLDLYVLQHVCQYLRRQIEAGTTVIPVFVPISSLDLADADCVARICAIPETNMVDPKWLKLEITGTILEDEQILQSMQMLRDAGFSITLADFGLNTSSLLMLSRLPVDRIKLSSDVIARIGDEAAVRSIVGGILSIAQELHIQTMAEGVETEEVTAILKGYECNLVQGEYYHHYMSEHDIAQLLNNTPM